MSWTVERIEVLKKMWGEGQSASVIAKALGGVNRGAVINKVHRLGLAHQSLELLLRKAEQGDAEAQFKYGVALSENQYGRGKNIIKAAEWFQNAADQDHMEAKLHLARAYSGASRAYNEDYGLEIDKKLALHYFKAATIQGSVDGCYDLAIAYESGWGGQKDLESAIRFFKKAAELGHVDAHYQIYSILNPRTTYKRFWLDPSGFKEADISEPIKNLLGNGKKINPFYWCELAAKKGHKYAIWVMGSRVLSDTESISREKRKKAFRWMELLAEKLISETDEIGEFYEALRIVGNTYLCGQHSYFGDGFEKNKEKAFKFIEALAHHLNDIEAHYFLGDAYVNGYGVEVDKAKAAEYFKLASTGTFGPLDYKTDFEFYGKLYVHASELRDYKEADNYGPYHHIWLTNISAYFRLGEMFMHGVGVQKDEILAKKYFNIVKNNSMDELERFEALDNLFTIKNGVKNSIVDSDSLDIIGRIEDDYIEYKQTFFRNVVADIATCKDTQFRAIKEIASFLNSHDGVLFIGVHDKTKEVIGIEEDGLIDGDLDGWNGRVQTALRNALGPIQKQNLKTTFGTKDGKTFYRIDCRESNQAVWITNWKYKGQDDHLYVRDSDSAIQLKGPRITEFMQSAKFSKK